MEDYKWKSVDVYILGKKVDTKAMKYTQNRPSKDKFEYYMHRNGKYYFRNKYRKLVIDKELNLKVGYGTEFDISFEVSNELSYTVLINDLGDEVSKIILQMPNIE